ncbi:ATP-dependent RNA helicase HrpA [Oceanicoccus sp.]|uniref:ATP-dependent RNA helicase HrpA n=1 Tax=Oceanicoccus sp. TaxID=2691044 RepID=UPI0034288062
MDQSQHSILNKLTSMVSQCMLVDRHPVQRKLQQLDKQLAEGKSITDAVQSLQSRIAKSIALVEQRQQQVPSINFPDLPIADKRDEIAQAISQHQVVVIAGETGSGKTTQLPKICLELGRGVNGLIGHTQPRRLAARTVAQRIADELETPLGEGVGYQVRFTDHVSENSHIKLMTDGILLAEIQRDKYLNRYDTLIIDEAHERSLNIDFLLGFLKQLLPKRPDLKVIITSATIDLESFSKHFNDAPIIEVSGRTYPVETLYRPLDDLSAEGDLITGIEMAISELMSVEGSAKGDVLVFLSGEGDIREVARHLRQLQKDERAWQHCEILPLYARLSNAEQNKVFNITGRRGRRIILATNVAETSLTVPGIRYVVDPGYARISRYSYRTKVQRLPIEPISQASANQRKGRCGRVAEGVCIRLYEEADFNNRPEFTDPEIKRTNLASVILQMLGMRMGAVDKFPFVDPPDHRMISDGFKLLEELGAVDKKRQLTSAGRTLTRFQVDPRLARMIIAAEKLDCLEEILVIVSALSIQDPRERPADKQQASDEKHRRFWHKESDFLSYVNLWNYYEEKRQELSQGQLRKLCQREFLAYMRMREWREIHHQLRLACRDLKYKLNKEPANYESVHKALLSGLLSHIANLDDDRQYLGARNRKLRIFPASALFKKNPKWIVAAEIAETSQVYARCCAQIQPEWLLGINDPLFKRSYSEPHWQQKAGRVMAYERLSLYGLMIREKTRVHYGPIEPRLSREILIRAGLVEGNIPKTLPTSKASFFSHNQQLVKDIEDLEAKSRRRDILVDDQQLFQFYDERIGLDVITLKHFEKWRKGAEHKQAKLLYIDKERLMQHGAAHINEMQFPARLSVGDLVFGLSYRFEPDHRADGVTVTIPIGLLNRIPRHRFEWLVPGMLRDKCIALVKLLPKNLRKQVVPVPEYVDKALAQISPDDSPLLEVLTRQLKQVAGVVIPMESWLPDQLDDFYRMNYRVVDADGKPLGQGRNLEKLLANFKGQVTETLQEQTQQRFQTDNIKQWDFGELPMEYQFNQAGVTVTSYPALVDCKNSVAIELKDFPEQAELESQRGLVRLFMLQMPQQLKYLRKELLRGNTISLQLAGISQQRDEWLDDLLFSVFHRVFIADKPLPRSDEAFQQRLQAEKKNLVEEASRAAEVLSEIAAIYTAIRKQLKSANELSWALAIGDIQQQLSLLFAPGFIKDTPWQYLQQYPRYLTAIDQRLEKLRGHFQRDKQLLVGLRELSEPLYAQWKNNHDAEIRSEQLLAFRWLLEEYRVSLFAQKLGTLQPVSEKRLKAMWQEVKTSLLDVSS